MLSVSGFYESYKQGKEYLHLCKHVDIVALNKLGFIFYVIKIYENTLRKDKNIKFQKYSSFNQN